VVKAISGVMTVRFKNELVRNITIKLGYANAKVGNAGRDHSPAADRPRSTNVKMRLVRGQAATAHTRRIKKTTHHANGPVVVDVTSSFDTYHLSTVQATIFLWRLCSTEPQLWTPRYC
jgi:hypothetical protein